METDAGRPNPDGGAEGGDGGVAQDGAPGLEARLRRLEEIVAELEAEDLELDRALGLFEEGVGHVKEAGKVLEAAKLRVEELLDESEDGGHG